MKTAKRSPELIEIDEARDRHKDIARWKNHLTAAMWLVYFVSLGVYMISSFENGLFILLLAVALFIVRIPVNSRERKRKFELATLIIQYKRKKAEPIYRELIKRFSDQPHIFFYIDGDGVINIIDRSQPRDAE